MPKRPAIACSRGAQVALTPTIVRPMPDDGWTILPPGLGGLVQDTRQSREQVVALLALL